MKDQGKSAFLKRRASEAVQAGDWATALQVYEQGLTLGKLTVMEKAEFLQGKATCHWELGDHTAGWEEIQEVNRLLWEEAGKLAEETEQRNAEQTATREILSALSGFQLDLRSLLEIIADNAAKVCGADDTHIYRIEQDRLIEWTHRGPIPGLAAGESLPLNRGSVIGRAIVDRKTIHIKDAAVELDETEYPVSFLLQRRWGYRTAMSTPLLRNGVPIGGIAIRRKVVQPFTEKQMVMLEVFANQAVIAIENVRLFDETQRLLKQTEQLRELEKRYTQSLERELEIGHQIQSGFLPSELPKVSGWGIAPYFQAAREVSGDFYDVFKLPDGRLGFFLGDVTDKGVGSALFMALYRSLLRAFIQDRSVSGRGMGLSSADLLLQTVKKTNHYVCQMHEQALFATLFIGVLDPLTGTVHYINAGQNPPQAVSQDGSRRALQPNSPLVGIMQDSIYSAEEVQLIQGEALCIYSDGVEDTQNEALEFYGLERLLEALSPPAKSASEYIQRLSASLANFRGEAKPFDDVTLLVIMRQGSAIAGRVD